MKRNLHKKSWIAAALATLTSMSSFAQTSTNQVNILPSAVTSPTFSGGSGGPNCIDGNLSTYFGNSYAGLANGTVNPVAYFNFSAPITLQNIGFTFYLHCRSYGNDSDFNTLYYRVQWQQNGGSWMGVPNGYDIRQANQYHDALDTWFDPGHGTTTISLSDLNLANCTAISVELYANSYDSKKGNCSGEAFLYEVQALLLTNAVTSNPQSANVFIGNSAQFAFAAQSGLPFQYQWFFQQTGQTTFNAISGATNANLVISAANSADAGCYQVVASNSMGTLISDNAGLVVEKPVLYIAANADSSLSLSWTNVFTGPLICTSTLGSESWTTVTLPAVNIGGQYVVTITPELSSMFYALGQPPGLTNSSILK